MAYGNILSAAIGLDFGLLPPEINSGRMYLGSGSGPLLTAAAAWDGLSNELSVAANSYTSVVTELTGMTWLGPASVAMAAAAMPYAAWLGLTAGQAAEMASQARAAAAAYELAHSMTVPPSVVAANRTLLLALIATNFFGQNAAAIAATEAHYAQMWIQDATAMNVYAESSALATTLPSFNEPPQTVDPAAGTGAEQLQAVLSSPSVQIIEHVPNVTNSVLSSANAVTSGRGIYAVNMRIAAQEVEQPEPPFPWARMASAPRVSAAWGRAGLVGKLSAPPSWFAAVPEVRPATLPLTESAAGFGPATSVDTGGSSVFSQCLLGTLSRDGPKPAPAKSKPIIVRSPAAG